MAQPLATIMIPARAGSSRFPNKIFVKNADGKTMIGTTARNCAMTGLPVIIVVDRDIFRCDARLDFYAEVNDINAELKSQGCETTVGIVESPVKFEPRNGMERLWQTMAFPQLTFAVGEFGVALPCNGRDVIIHVQADEPNLMPGDLHACLASFLRRPVVDFVTLACPASPADLLDESVVKVAPLSSDNQLTQRFVRRAKGTRWSAHVGVYVYDRAFLAWYNELPQAASEAALSLEQLRATANGATCRVVKMGDRVIGVNSIQDYELHFKNTRMVRFSERWESDQTATRKFTPADDGGSGIGHAGEGGIPADITESPENREGGSIVRES